MLSDAGLKRLYPAGLDGYFPAVAGKSKIGLQGVDVSEKRENQPAVSVQEIPMENCEFCHSSGSVNQWGICEVCGEENEDISVRQSEVPESRVHAKEKQTASDDRDDARRED